MRSLEANRVAAPRFCAAPFIRGSPCLADCLTCRAVECNGATRHDETFALDDPAGRSGPGGLRPDSGLLFGRLRARLRPRLWRRLWLPSWRLLGPTLCRQTGLWSAAGLLRSTPGRSGRRLWSRQASGRLSRRLSWRPAGRLSWWPYCWRPADGAAYGTAGRRTPACALCRTNLGGPRPCRRTSRRPEIGVRSALSLSKRPLFERRAPLILPPPPARRRRLISVFMTKLDCCGATSACQQKPTP